MADHWSFVAAAYGLAAVALAVYWRRLVRRDRELSALERRRAARTRSVAAPDAVRR
jgi:heme exporter protein D